METDKVNHHGLHLEKNSEIDVLPTIDHVWEQEENPSKTELDALEEKLFAMAKSRYR